jgi:hypothetical protein
MKWIGQHIYDLVARFRNDVYLEDLSTTTETNVLVIDSTGKVSKNTTTVGDITGITEGDNITVTDPTGPTPTVALSTNVDVAGTLDVTDLGTFDASIAVTGKIRLNDGGNSVFVGEDAGLNDDASANQNVGVGRQALRANTTGDNNSAVGYVALYSNTTGGVNTANGSAALYSNTTGSANTANGSGALYSNTTGNVNTANGQGALLGNTIGSSNIAVGSSAGTYITNGINLNTVTSNSVFLGANTKALASSQTNQIVIGYNTTGLGSNTAILGNSSITKTQLQGNVGIGTDTPSQKLDVVGNIATAGVVIDGDTTITRVSAGRIAVEGVNVVTTSSEDSLENKTFAVGATFKGSTSGGTYLQASAVAGTTTLTLPAATDTLVGRDTTDTLTFKTLFRPTIEGYARLEGDVSGSTTLQASEVAGTTFLTLPAATDTLVGKDTIDILTNKTLTSPTLETPILGTPQSGDLTNCTFPTLNQSTTGTAATVTGAAQASITSLGTLTGLTTSGAIELGHASDTTIARLAAGVVTIEGNQIITSKPTTVGSGQAGQLGMQMARRTITQAEMNALHTTPIAIIPALGANLVAIPTHCTAFVDTASTNSGTGDLIFGYDSPASGIKLYILF